MTKKRKIFCGRCTEPLTLTEGERYGILHIRTLGMKGQQTEHLCDECLVDSGISHRLIGATYAKVDQRLKEAEDFKEKVLAIVRKHQHSGNYSINGRLVSIDYIQEKELKELFDESNEKEGKGGVKQ